METAAHDLPNGLDAFRRRAVRAIAVAMGLGVGLLAILLPASDPGVPAVSVVLLAAAASIHLVAATTVGRSWDPHGPVGLLYALLIAALVAIAVAVGQSPDSDTFWFLLIPVSLSAITQGRFRHTLMTVTSFALYLTGSAVGPGLIAATWVPRGAALALFAAGLLLLVEQLESALVSSERANADLAVLLNEATVVNERLVAVDRLKDDFISVASHELRTPLTVVLGFAQTLTARWDTMTDDERRQFVVRIESHATSLSGIIATMLDTARLEHGTLRAAEERVRLAPLVTDAADRMSTLLRDHHLDVDVALDPVVRGDTPLLERAIDNLLSNAARHTPPGTRVEVRLRRLDQAVRIEVSDNGPGIASDDLERIGHRFQQARDPDRRTREGVGLGLALVNDVLTAMGSRLQIDSETGVGSIFSFELPVWTAPATPRAGRGPNDEKGHVV